MVDDANPRLAVLGEVRDEMEVLPQSRSQVDEAIGKAESSETEATGDATSDDESITEDDHDRRKDGTEEQLQVEIKRAKSEEIRRLSLVEIPLGDSFEDQTITHVRVPLPGFDIDGTPADFVHGETELEEREKARRRRINRFFGGMKVGIEQNEEARNNGSKRRRSVPIEYCNTDRRDVPRFCAICLSKVSIGETMAVGAREEESEELLEPSDERAASERSRLPLLSATIRVQLHRH
ncbi:hypothetical protein THAOC_18251 [Thalassiosira oceanica]|uniref:Uncharacterized protein n=1 Tax=Thalassiosira oceanica TaxID=159749 RepID=K0SSP4_THAOC|nr:hypothetical protein THAOC_18251 [Thalassiosira oceanica]|eukprot:EJK61292.1 hypothetical protein THAOC_18251 [Thalassiosira oceanica]